FGGSAEGSPEDTYIRNLQQHTGGQLLHGSYSMRDLVNAMVPGGSDMQPISNFYAGGHIMLVPRANATYLNPPTPDSQYVGALVTGDVNENNVLNRTSGGFFDMYDARMREL